MSGVMRIVKSDRDERVDYELSMGDGDYQLVGRIERVGADHLDLAAGLDGPPGAATSWSVPFAALRVVRSA